MNSNMIHPVQTPAEYMPSVYCNTPEMHARDLPGMVSVNMRELFPILPEACYVKDGDDLGVIAQKTREALEHVDMSNITPETSVNLVCSEHGFCICGGKPYLQMLKTIREVVLERTGCIDFRLRVVMWRTSKEGTEAIDFYHLKEEFDNNVDYSWAYDKAVPIETRIGTLYGLEKVYDADRIILAYYDDPREIYAHNVYKKAFKAFTMNMDAEELSELLTSMGAAKSATYESNLSSLGYVDFDQPSGISIYPLDFESKAQVVSLLDGYNARMEAEGKSEQVITYTDMVGTLMSSVTDIVDIISYVLIAFVAISLVVSSIMIGVITYISVLERKKEIGILRAIGASKGNIAQVFNAETFIIGLTAGLIGIGLTLLLLLPINAIIHHLAGTSDISAFLPPQYAAVLIVLSVLLTLLGGLIPSRKAAKSDPVTALRTE